jgi:hypothetical protein
MQHLLAAYTALKKEMYTMERSIYTKILSFDNYRMILLRIPLFFSIVLFLFSVTLSFAQNISLSNESTVQITWTAQIPEPDHYRIEVRKSDGNELSAPVFEYSLHNICTLPVQPGSEYHIRIQSVTAYGELSPFSEGINFNTSEVGPAVSTNWNNQTTPLNFIVRQNQPNPFNPTTTITYSLPAQKHVQIIIFNITGQKISTLQDAILPAGVHSIKWDASSFPSGTYFYTVIAGDNRITNKMMFLK